MASRPADESAQSRLTRTLQQFVYLQGTIKEAYERVRERIQRFNNEGGDIDFDYEFMEKMSYGAPSITVVGETNSGKTSLVNELLGNSHLPVCQKSNTGRQVVVKYSENNYYKVINSLGVVIDSGSFDKEVPKHVIFPESRRSDRDTVEVGLDKPILQGGLEIMVLPGLGESNLIDEVISRCVDGVLQIVIYVIDAESGIKLRELPYLQQLKDKNLDIYFVCNKIDYYTTSERFSGEAFDDKSQSSGDSHFHAKEEENIDSTLDRLQNGPSGCLLDSSQFNSRLHTLSLEKVRLARVERRTDDYTSNFSRFIDTISENIEDCIQTDMNEARGLLDRFQRYLDEYQARTNRNRQLTIQEANEQEDSTGDEEELIMTASVPIMLLSTESDDFSRDRRCI